MATSLNLLTTKPEAMDHEAKPAAMEFVKSNKGRKPNGKGPYQKKQAQRGMGVEKLERLRIATESKTTMNQFCSEPIGASNVVPVFHGVEKYGVPVPVRPMVINGGLCSGFGGFNGGQVLLGNTTGNVQVACGAAHAHAELSSMPKFQQYSKPDPCDFCFKKKRCNGENVKFNGGSVNQFGQVYQHKGVDLHGYWNHQNNYQNTNEVMMNGFTTRAARSAYAYTATQMKNETVDVVAIHRKGNSVGSGSYVMEYEFFPGKNNTASKEWEFPNEEVVAALSATHEPSSSSSSKCVDLSLKLSY